MPKGVQHVSNNALRWALDNLDRDGATPSLLFHQRQSIIRRPIIADNHASGRWLLAQNAAELFANKVRAVVGADDHFIRDRKSTRLNSSHVAISYAVFCLKKKKATQENQTR